MVSRTVAPAASRHWPRLKIATSTWALNDAGIKSVSELWPNCPAIVINLEDGESVVVQMCEYDGAKGACLAGRRSEAW